MTPHRGARDPTPDAAPIPDGGIVLVIGGAGVLGRMTLPFMAARHRLRVLDLVPSAVRGVESVVGDATRAEDVVGALSGVSAVVHQAVVVPRGELADDPSVVAGAFAVNTASVHLAATAARDARVASFVHISTLGVYGGYSLEQQDSRSAADAAHPYGLTKRLGEEVVEAVFRSSATTSCSLRLGYPTPDEDWPLWRPPVGPRRSPTMPDGRPILPVAGSDVAAAITSALAYRGEHRRFVVSADKEQASIDTEESNRALGWQPTMR